MSPFSFFHMLFVAISLATPVISSALPSLPRSSLSKRLYIDPTCTGSQDIAQDIATAESMVTKAYSAVLNDNDNDNDHFDFFFPGTSRADVANIFALVMHSFSFTDDATAGPLGTWTIECTPQAALLAECTNNPGAFYVPVEIKNGGLVAMETPICPPFWTLPTSAACGWSDRSLTLILAGVFRWGVAEPTVNNYMFYAQAVNLGCPVSAYGFLG